MQAHQLSKEGRTSSPTARHARHKTINGDAPRAASTRTRPIARHRDGINGEEVKEGIKACSRKGARRSF